VHDLQIVAVLGDDIEGVEAVAHHFWLLLAFLEKEQVVVQYVHTEEE